MEYKISKAVMDKIELDIAESYINPISFVMEDLAETVKAQMENKVMYSVNKKVNVNVDKEELVRALKYDREQYDKGYRDAIIKYADLLEENVRLEKALDKACVFIDDITGTCPLDQFDVRLSRCECCDNDSAECWKAWCLENEL